jgi:outer membrane protein TolC
LQPVEDFERRFAASSRLPDGSAGDNPQLQAVRILTNAAGRARGMAAARFLPKINAFYSYSWPWFIDDRDKLAERKEQTGWSAGITAGIPLFAGFRNTAGYRKASYEFMKAEVDLQRVENLFSVNRSRICLFHQAAWESVGAAKKQQELMEKNLEIMQMRYDGGMVNQSQLLEVSLGARMARIGYIRKLFECLLLEAEYLKSIGKLEVTL